MAPKVTSSSNRSKGKASKPVTKGQNPQRANRQKVSQAKNTGSGVYGRGGQFEHKRGDSAWTKVTPKTSARVTSSLERASTGSAPVTTSERPALPPGKKGGALARSSAPAPKALPGKPAPKALPGGTGGADSVRASGVRTGRPGAARPALPASIARTAAAAGAKAPISMGGLVRGGVIGAVGLAAADYVGRKAGEAIGTSIRNAASPQRTGTRSGRTGRGGTTNDVGGNPARDGRYIPGSQQVKFNQPKPAPKPEAPATRPATQSRSSASPARMPSAVTRSSSPTGAKPKAPQSSGYSAPKPPNMEKVETTTTDAPKPPTAKDLMKAVTRRGVGRDEMVQDNLRRAKKNRG